MSPQDQIQRIETLAHQQPTACAAGVMPWRIWQRDHAARPTLVLLHGGSGSWNHWVRNVEPLSHHFRVVAPDLPGLGDAATLPRPYTVDSTADIVEAGLQQVLGSTPFHLAAFSWGCTLAGVMAARRTAGSVHPGASQAADARPLRSLFLIGPAALGAYQRGSMQPLRHRWPGMTETELNGVNRDNLARLMLHEERNIDDLAVYLQVLNTNRARFNSPQFARSEILLQALHHTRAPPCTPLSVVYGEFDAPVHPHVAARRERILAARPDAHFDVIPRTGHWAQYERADDINQRLIAWVNSNDGEVAVSM